MWKISFCNIIVNKKRANVSRDCDGANDNIKETTISTVFL